MNLERELLSSDDPERAKTLLNLAVVQKAKGDVNSALICLEEALSIWKRAYGEHNRYIAKCLNNMGILFVQHQPHRALECFEKALAIRRQFLPANDAEIAENIGNIGDIHGILGHHKLALTYAKQTLAMLTETLPSMSLKMADAYRSVGVAHATLGQYQDALYFYHKAAAILRQIVESDHPQRLQSEEDLVRTTIRRTHASFNARFDKMLALILDKHMAEQTGTPDYNTK